MKAEGKEKKQRQSQSCDACRVRKVKCEPMTAVLEGRMTGTTKTEDSEPNTAQDGATEGSGRKTQPPMGKGPCKQCFQLGVECLYIYQPRKRGPPNLYLRRLSEAQKTGQSFPAEADFEAAKASSRAVAERRKAKGKGKDGHALEHVVEEERKDGINGDVESWDAAGYRSVEGMSEMLDATSSNGTTQSSQHVASQQNYDPRQSAATEDGHLMNQSFVRTPLPDSSSIAQADHRRYSQGNFVVGTATGQPASEDAFTPSQFMNLDGDLNFAATPGNSKTSASHAKYPPRQTSRQDSFPEMGEMSTRQFANSHPGRAYSSNTVAFPMRHHPPPKGSEPTR